MRNAMARPFIRDGFFVLFVLVCLIPYRAQAQEVQVPLSPDSTITTIDAELRNALNLFPDVAGFQQAQLFKLSENEYELVIAYREGAQVLRERRLLTAADVADLRQRVARGLETSDRRVGLNQEGQVGLIASTTVLGLVEGGLLAGAFGVEDEGAVALPLMGGALGFFVPLMATQNAPVTEAEADLTFYGGVQGYVHAVQLATLADGDADGPAVAGLAAVLGAVEGTVGYLTARSSGWSGGHAEMVSLNGVSGNLLGLGLGASLADDANVAAGVSLLGSIAGVYFGHRMGQTERYTQGDARIYVQTGWQAVNLTGSLLAAADADDGRSVAALVTGTGAAGLALGRVLVRNRTFTKGEANLTFLGSVAGSLLGGGVAALSDVDGSGVAVMQALGSAAGFGITYGLFAGDARQRTTLSAAGMDLQLRLEPHFTGQRGGPGAGATGVGPVTPRVTFRASF